MAKQYGRNAVILAVKDGAYGVQNKNLATAVVIQGNMTIDPGIQPIECNEKSGKTYKNDKQMVQGQKKPTATMTGEIAETNIDLLLGCSMHDNTPFVWGATTSIYSYTLYVYDVEEKTYDYITGAVCESLTITGTQGDKLTFSANFRGADSDFDVVDAGGDSLESVPDEYNLTPMLFQNIAAKVMGVGTWTSKLISFNLTLNNEYQDDTLSFFNSQKRQQEIVCRQTGTFGYSFQSDTETNDYIFDNLINTVRNAKLQIRRDILSNYWTFDIYGIFLTYENPMDTECQRVLSAEMEIVEDASDENDPIKITYTTT